MFAFWLPKDHVFPWYWHLGLCICSWFDNLWFLQANIKNCRAGTIFYTDFNHRKCIIYALSLLKCCLFFDDEPLICSIHSVFKVIILKTKKKVTPGHYKIVTPGLLKCWFWPWMRNFLHFGCLKILLSPWYWLIGLCICFTF